IRDFHVTGVQTCALPILPLNIICAMMGIPEDLRETVFADSNIVLAGNDPDYLGEDADTAVRRLLEAGAELSGILAELAGERRRQIGRASCRERVRVSVAA